MSDIEFTKFIRSSMFSQFKVDTVNSVNRANKVNFLFISFCFMLFFCTSAFAEGLSGWANLNYITTEQKEDDDTISKERSFYRNLYLTFERPLTPLISYQLYLRTNWSDFRLTDADDRVTNTYQRAIEPAFDIFLRNPMYDLSAGYRRMEQWSTASLQDEGRRTTDFMYSRLNITPREFPSLSLQIDRQKNFDYLSPRRIDITDTRFTGNSWYQYLYKGLTLSYNFTYIHDIVETPLEIIEKTKNYNFNGIYNIGYNRTFWAGKANISANYQGNYIRDKNRFLVKEEGTASLERLRLRGLYINDPTPDDMTSLNPQPSLINDQFTDSTGITLNTSFQNIGVQVELRSISKILIYYRNNGIAKPVTWRVYYRNNDLENWTLLTTLTVSPAFDSVNNAYRYELTFTPTTASFFKVVNINTISPVNGSNVEVSEIKVYDIETVTETGTLTEVNNFFNQGVNLIANVRPIPKLGLSLNYFINRSDQNPVSIWNSMGGVFSNIFSKSISDDDRLISNVLRVYGGTAEWLTHRFLTTTLRFQRNEAFDNRDETDFSSNTYSLTFNSVPVPTLDANLSLIRNDNYNFGEKDNTNNSVLLSIVAKLYRDVNMVTDMGYTHSKSYTNNTRSDTTSIRGSIDANLTQKLYGSLIYGFSRTSSSDNTTIDTTEGQTIITYRPGRFINITGTLRAMDVDGDTTTSEGILIDWLPLPSIRLNLNYLHSNSDIEPTMSDILSAYLIWYITKFLDLQLTYSYTREERDVVEKIHSVGANLNCRFW
ncbi:MAG: hypothetical protein ACUVUQ_00910 [Thermodesulfovibrionales bacterium]